MITRGFASHLPLIAALLAAVVVSDVGADLQAPSPPSSLRIQSGSWEQLYEQAIAHISQRQWAEAERKLNEAKTLGPRPGPRVVRYGQLPEPYFPDFYLGVVYQNTGRPKEALEAYQAAKGQGLNANVAGFAQLDTFATRAAEAVRLADAAGPRTETPKTDTPTPSLPTGTPATTVTRNVEQPKPSAGGTGAPAANSTPTEPKAAEPTGGGVPIDPPGNSAGNNAAARQQSFDRLMGQALERQRSGDFAAAARAARQAGDLGINRAAVDALLKQIGEDEARAVTAADVATRESQGMRLFLVGDYSRALGTLARLQTPVAYFYRACSLAAMALLNPVDATRMTEARAEYAQAMRNRRELQKHQPFVSPKILQALASPAAYD